MFEHREKIDATAPAERVFAFLTDLDRRPEWQKHLRGVDKLSDGDLRVGYQFRDVSKFGPTVLEVKALESPRHLAYATAGGPFDVSVEMRVSPTDQGCETDVSIRMQPLGFMRVVWPVMKFIIRPQIKKDAAGLRRCLGDI